MSPQEIENISPRKLLQGLDILVWILDDNPGDITWSFMLVGGAREALESLGQYMLRPFVAVE